MANQPLVSRRGSDSWSLMTCWWRRTQTRKMLDSRSTRMSDWISTRCRLVWHAQTPMRIIRIWSQLYPTFVSMEFRIWGCTLLYIGAWFRLVNNNYRMGLVQVCSRPARAQALAYVGIEVQVRNFNYYCH